MRRCLIYALAALLPGSALAQGTGTNPPVGALWTYLGPTYGAGWAPPGNPVPPITLNSNIIAPFVNSNEGAALTAESRSGFTAMQIADWVFCNLCVSPNSYDALRGIGILNPGTVQSSSGGLNLVNGVGGYVMAQAGFGGVFPTGAALFGMAIADANNSAVWGINTAISDNRGLFVTANTGRQLFNEFDLEFTSPNSTGIGLQVAGSSPSPPAFSLGLVCSNLGGTNPAVKWSTCFYSGAGVAGNVVTASQTAFSGSSLGSQNYSMIVTNASGVVKAVSFSAQPDQSVLFGNTDNKITFLGGAGLDSSNVAGPFAINVGATALSGTSVPSQGIQLNVRDAAGTAKTVGFAAQPNLGILFTNNAGTPVQLTGINAVMGTAAALTLSGAELGFNRMAASGAAPGAGGGKIAMVCGTTAGSLKIIAYGGTSTTPVTVADNIGTGATGC